MPRGDGAEAPAQTAGFQNVAVFQNVGNGAALHPEDLIAAPGNAANDLPLAQGHQGLPHRGFAAPVGFNERPLREDLAGLIGVVEDLIHNGIADLG